MNDEKEKGDDEPSQNPPDPLTRDDKSLIFHQELATYSMRYY